MVVPPPGLSSTIDGAAGGGPERLGEDAHRVVGARARAERHDDAQALPAWARAARETRADGGQVNACVASAPCQAFPWMAFIASRQHAAGIAGGAALRQPTWPSGRTSTAPSLDAVESRATAGPSWRRADRDRLDLEPRRRVGPGGALGAGQQHESVADQVDRRDSPRRRSAPRRAARGRRARRRARSRSPDWARPAAACRRASTAADCRWRRRSCLARSGTRAARPGPAASSPSGPSSGVGQRLLGDRLAKRLALVVVGVQQRRRPPCPAAPRPASSTGSGRPARRCSCRSRRSAASRARRRRPGRCGRRDSARRHAPRRPTAPRPAP